MTAVSQTAGPETVLCGEAELPYALLGYLTDYANGVPDEATPVATLVAMMAASTATFADGPRRGRPARRRRRRPHRPASSTASSAARSRTETSPRPEIRRLVVAERAGAAVPSQSVTPS